MSKTSLTMYNTITKSIKLRGYITLSTDSHNQLTSQNITVKGVVVDETDTPLIGATVMVKVHLLELLLTSTETLR